MKQSYHVGLWGYLHVPDDCNTTSTGMTIDTTPKGKLTVWVAMYSLACGILPGDLLHAIQRRKVIRERSKQETVTSW